jgi:hypothetical protein
MNMVWGLMQTSDAKAFAAARSRTTTSPTDRKIAFYFSASLARQRE